jgi:hypothetical protein
MSKLRRDKEQRKADRKEKRQAPKVKMRSYGDGEKLPIVKSGGDFYLADQKYDNLGHGEFEGQMTGKLQGPSKRAIKGKGKKSANVRVGYGEDRASDDGDPIFLQDTSPINIKNDYSSMRSMGQAVAKWTSPDSSLLQKGEVNVGAMSELTSNIAKQREEAKAKADSDAAAKKEKIEKRKVKATKTVQTLGSFLADLKPGGTKVKKAGVAAEQPKEDKDKDKDKDKKVDSGVKNLDNLTKTLTPS